MLPLPRFTASTINTWYIPHSRAITSALCSLHVYTGTRKMSMCLTSSATRYVRTHAEIRCCRTSTGQFGIEQSYSLDAYSHTKKAGQMGQAPRHRKPLLPPPAHDALYTEPHLPSGALDVEAITGEDHLDHHGKRGAVAFVDAPPIHSLIGTRCVLR